MIPTVIHRECPPEFTPELRSAVVDTLRAAYDIANGNYDPEQGVRDRVHGITVFDVVTFRFERDLHGFSRVSFESHGAGPELRVGALRVRWNKVGRQANGQSIERSFPRPSRASAEMAIGNQQLPLWADELDLGRPLNWYICHVGNPIDGLVAIYLAAPANADGERITAWQTAVPIWSAGEPDTEFPVLPPPGLPEPPALPAWDIALLDEDQAESDAAG